MNRLTRKNKTGEYELLTKNKPLDELLSHLGPYEDLEERLCQIFHGEITLENICHQMEAQLREPDHTDNYRARVLTYEDSDEWDAFKKAQMEGRVIIIPEK